MAELVDALGLGPSGETLESSSLSARTFIFSGMINFLHSFLPQAVLFSMGPLTIYWYGLFLVLAMTASIIVAQSLAKWHQIKTEKIIDLSLWLIIAGILGARVYEIFLELPYYYQHPLNILKIWEGGLAIHGGIIAGAITLYLFSRRHHLSSLKLAAIIVPALALGQAIGRWGNWFNQELFGRPTNLPWGIPIAIENRPWLYLFNDFFHPTFLYESFGCFLIFITLVYLSYRWRANLNTRRNIIIINIYLLAYGSLRLALEFIKVDVTPMLGIWRWPQIISALIIIFSITWLIKTFKK